MSHDWQSTRAFWRRGILSLAIIAGALAGTILRETSADEPPKAEPAKTESAAPEKPKTDLDVLQGKWKLVSIEINGEANNSPGDDAWIEFAGDRLKSNKENELFKVKLDATTDPKLIDLEKIEGSDAGQSLEGIYTLKDDKFTVCVSAGEGVRIRPTEFSGKEGSGFVLVVLERIKP